jgi:hypothetical protein
MRDGQRLARAQGIYYVATGSWPLIHMRSFEFVLGPKKEHWLVRTVGVLLIANGMSQLRVDSAAADIGAVRRTGVATAAALTLIDLTYALPGRISRIYLLDALVEAGWIVAWTKRGRPSASGF